MGQRFVSNDAPWSQALHQLDLTGLSAEEFVGALEAAAQAAGSRALLVIDALNEGAGRTIWPSHLEAFIAHLERSTWIGVILAVRSSYEEIVVPVEMRSRANVVTHQGFTEHEYDATKTFFVHFGLELPSTPLLAPEFRNPLFLKTLCRGLNAKGERRLPRGFQGITMVFDLYLSAVNERLAGSLGFHPKIPLVRQALEAIATATLDSGQTWLTLARAGEIADAFLPGREFERSLYRGLVVEGVLLEEVERHDEQFEQVVSVAYERFADHLAAKTLLERHLDLDDPASAFAQGGPLAFIGDEEEYVAPGLLEALCIQIPERTGQELLSIAPFAAEVWGIGNAFRQSIVWRTHSAFSEGTRDALNELCRTEYDLHDTFDVLLTVATLPGHPLNAWFLDKRLRKAAMAERDAWWSVYLHKLRKTCGAVDRLMDWASSLRSGALIDDETIDLCAITLSWMLTSSNRFLRDRATNALVDLLTARLAAVIRLVERFADVDDAYVGERVYAVAYGVAMRSRDSVAVGTLAACVYGRVFASGNPPPHILLRDYARGVVERALYLGAQVEIDASRIRPPYSSQWPVIPSEEDIKPLLADWSKGSHDSRELEWSRNRIASSVLDDDFARYVIGTNSAVSGDWLSLTLAEPPWEPSLPPDKLLEQLIEDLSPEECSAWEKYSKANEACATEMRTLVEDWFAERQKDGKLSSLSHDNIAAEIAKVRTPELTVAETARDAARDAVESTFSTNHAERFSAIMDMEDVNRAQREPPRFELRQLQRYILKRVFDLGWTTERFGHFDRFSIGSEGRKASKAERIGKKYQWIAYHEILALVADRFQYREKYREDEGDKAYEGPWQDSFRDIDPSWTQPSMKGRTSSSGHAAAWWEQTQFNSWGDVGNERSWILRTDDLPRVEDLLKATSPNDGQRWLNTQCYFTWKQRVPADLESTEIEQGELWYLCTGYLIRNDDAAHFLKWAEGVDFWGKWMPDPAEVHRIFLGEHAWAPASRYFENRYHGDDGWTQPDHGCPVKLRTTALEYLREGRGFDCSVEESYTLSLPVRELVTGLGICWSGRGADFVDATGRLVSQDPTAHGLGPSALLLREDLLREFLHREGLTLCWAVVGEKHILNTGFELSHHPALRISGAYVLCDSGVTGFVKYLLDERSVKQGALRLIDTHRTEP
nr:AVAST type 2 anti-phage system protein Avs2 [Stigmatella aurantiaca]